MQVLVAVFFVAKILYGVLFLGRLLNVVWLLSILAQGFLFERIGINVKKLLIFLIGISFQIVYFGSGFLAFSEAQELRFGTAVFIYIGLNVAILVFMVAFHIFIFKNRNVLAMFSLQQQLSNLQNKNN